MPIFSQLTLFQLPQEDRDGGRAAHARESAVARGDREDLARAAQGTIAQNLTRCACTALVLCGVSLDALCLCPVDAHAASAERVQWTTFVRSSCSTATAATTRERQRRPCRRGAANEASESAHGPRHALPRGSWIGFGVRYVIMQTDAMRACGFVASCSYCMSMWRLCC